MLSPAGPLHRGARLLDVACGTGNLAVVAARHGCVVKRHRHRGNHIAQARARAATEDLRIDFKVGDAEALPFADGQFDLVVSKQYPRSEQQYFPERLALRFQVG